MKADNKVVLMTILLYFIQNQDISSNLLIL